MSDRTELHRLEDLVKFMRGHGVLSLKVDGAELVLNPDYRPTEPEDAPPPTVQPSPQELAQSRKDAQFFDIFGRVMTEDEKLMYKDVPSFIP